MPRETGNPLNLQRLAGELYFKPTGDNGYLSLGDVTMFKETPETETVAGYFHTRAAAQRQVRTDNKSTTLKWEVECQERTPAIEALLLFGKVGADIVQTAAASSTATISAVMPGRIYDLPKVMVTVTAVMVSAVAKIVGKRVDGEVVPANADVIVDDALGTIEVRESGTVAALSVLSVTYTAAAVTMRQISEIGKYPQQVGAFRLVGFDGASSPAAKIFEFDGQLVPKDRGQFDTEAFNKFTFELIATGDVSARLAA